MRAVGMILLQAVINLIITPQHSRLNQDKEYTRDLLAEHTRRVFNMLRMRLEVFEALLNQLLKNTNLEGSKWIDPTEKLIMFLVLVGQDLSYRLVSGWFGHGLDTISKMFKEVLYAVITLYKRTVRLPCSDTLLSSRISPRNPKFYPFFKDCVGALDGSHIPAHISLTKQPA